MRFGAPRVTVWAYWRALRKSRAERACWASVALRWRMRADSLASSTPPPDSWANAGAEQSRPAISSGARRRVGATMQVMVEVTETPRFVGEILHPAVRRVRFFLRPAPFSG